jgi:hypothetical protein
MVELVGQGYQRGLPRQVLLPKTTYTSEIVCPLPFHRLVSHFKKFCIFQPY